MPLRHLSQCNRHVARQAGFGRQQIVVAWIQPMLANVIPDRKKLPPLIVEKLEIHAPQRVAAASQVVELT